MGRARNAKACCSFCRKSHTDVGPLVEGPGNAYICGECVELCQSIIEQERFRRASRDAGAITSPTAESLRSALDQLVVGLENAKDGLLLAALALIKLSETDRQRAVLLIGSSRSSKILVARALAHVLRLPFVAADAELLIQSGNDGTQLLFDQLLAVAEYDIERAKHGIVYVDGADSPVAQEKVAQLWEEIELGPPDHSLKIATKHILFLFGGTFENLDADLACKPPDSEKVMTGEILETYGLVPSLIVRLQSLVTVDPLDEAGLEKVVWQVDFKQKMKHGARQIAADEPRCCPRHPE